MENTLKWSGVVALVILATIGAMSLVSSKSDGLLGGGTRFPNGISADTTSPVSGEVRGTTLTITGAQTLTGAATLSSTLGVTATTTLSDTVNFNNPGICINFYATSTATRMHMTASSTSLVNGVSTGVMLIDYGACAL